MKMRRVGVVLLASALVVAAVSYSSQHSTLKVALGMQGTDGMEVDLSTLSRGAQMQVLAHARGNIMSTVSGKGQYDALLSNGPLDPPRASTINKIASQTLANIDRKVGVNGKAPSSSGIGIGGKVHLLRSAEQILAGRMASALEGQKGSAKGHASPEKMGRKEAHVAHAVWKAPVQQTLQEQQAALRAKVRELEDAAGSAEISNLSDLSQ